MDEVFAELRAHFHEWSGNYESEHDLIGFAYYEGCGGSSCCGSILAQAAPLALGKELVRKHGFVWTMTRAKDDWHFAVVHPSVGLLIDLQSIDDGSWLESAGYDPQPPGKRTHASYENIVKELEKNR